MSPLVGSIIQVFVFDLLSPVFDLLSPVFCCVSIELFIYGPL